MPRGHSQPKGFRERRRSVQAPKREGRKSSRPVFSPGQKVIVSGPRGSEGIVIVQRVKGKKLLFKARQLPWNDKVNVIAVVDAKNARAHVLSKPKHRIVSRKEKRIVERKRTRLKRLQGEIVWGTVSPLLPKEIREKKLAQVQRRQRMIKALERELKS